MDRSCLQLNPSHRAPPPGRSLSGQIPAGVIGNLTDLTFLSLRYNSLTGPIPSDITSCKQLQYIYLQGNRFTGEIPAAIFSFSNLIRLNLANNNFSGEISPSFNNLTHLASLYLENNRLTGEIPELNIPSLNLFNVSNNLLQGSIPSKLAIMPASAFEGNSLCGAPLSSCSNNSKKKLSGGAIAGIVIGAVVALIVILFLIIIMCCRRSKEKKEGAVNVASAKAMDVEMAEEKAMADKERRSLGVEQTGAVAGAVKEGAKGGGIDKSLVFIGNYVPSRVYDLDDLLRASAEVLGKGTYGTTYKASLEIGITVAVKRLKDVIIKEKELKGKMEEIGRMNHENLVALKAYHCSLNEKLIVSDYMPMGSLSALLHGNRGGGRTPLNWETRSMIALGAARGITYIHSQSPTTSHGNIKSSNILLSNSYQARVSDFGLAQLATPTTPPNRIAGYRAPEVTDSRKVSQKADVYSFGVFLLELLTGKAPTHTHTLLNEQGVDLPRWVQSVVQQEWSAEVFDEELLRYQNVEEEMVQLLQLAVDCTAHYPDTRPSMAELTSRIEQICGSTSRREQELFEDIVDDEAVELEVKVIKDSSSEVLVSEDRGVFKADEVHCAEGLPSGDIEPEDINLVLTRTPMETAKVIDEAVSEFKE
ncbi:hypothetical protein Nepgr_007001 [Nepenthes gracilis]|uniref:Protein kinase domain-containing protein n=1 Tax=Nepenthes gracilis TaxID=150966 RepID=A0AAD3XI43_NEPGR|nr:hypothetical protein Nepgr_007001 [Nepenthes gracilis]